MSASIVHLVRHGEVHNPNGVLYGRLPNFGLSQRGHDMAQLTANWFAERRANGAVVGRLVTSPLLRARQTSEPIAEALGLDPVVEPRVIEAASKLQGLSKVAKRLRNPRRWPLLRNPLRPTWGEPYADQVQRMAGAVMDHRDAVLAQGEASEVVIVSHQLPIWVTRLASEGRSLGLNAGRRECTLASVTSLHFDGNEFVGFEYNEPAEELLAGAANVPGA